MDTFLQQFINGLSLGAIYALIALGYTMVYGVLRLINFAHGDVYMLGAFAGYYIANAMNMDANPSILGAIVVTMGAMAACAVIGMLIERLAYRPVRPEAKAEEATKFESPVKTRAFISTAPASRDRTRVRDLFPRPDRWLSRRRAVARRVPRRFWRAREIARGW